MSTPRDPLPTAALAHHTASLRALAARLVRDAAAADDLVQQTWLRAIERPPRDGSRIGRWLRTVLRNEARQHHRGEAARRRREHARARPERTTADDVVERTEQIERLLACVRRLAEPYRTTMLLRWVDGLTPTEIAARMGEPAGTVRSRLSRGMELLKSRLDHEHGTRRGWALALVPAAAYALPGALAMKGTLKLAVAAVILLAVGTGGWFAAKAIWPASTPPATERMQAGGAMSATGPALEGRGTAAPVTATPPVDADRGAWVVKGNVYGGGRTPLAGARVLVEARWPGLRVALGHATTGADGGYRVAIAALAKEGAVRRAAAELLVSADKPGYTSRPAGIVRIPAPLDEAALPVRCDVHLLQGAMLRGRVFDGAGKPVSGGRVAVRYPGGGTSTLDVDSEGRYLKRINKTDELTITYMRVGLGEGSTPPFLVREGQDATAPDIHLEGRGRIEGVAQFPNGEPAAHVKILATRVRDAGAEDVGGVGLGDSSTVTDEQGRFAFTALRDGRYRIFDQRFAKPRLAPIHVLGSRGVVVTVQGPRLRVRVRDPEGRPVPGAGFMLRFNLDQEIPDIDTGGVEGPHGVISRWALAGKRYEIAVHVRGVPWATAAVTVPDNRNEAVVDVVLRPGDGESGPLRFKILGPDGAPMTASDVRLWTRVAHAPVSLPTPKDESGWQRLGAFDPGEYVLRVTPGPKESPAPLALWFPVETPVTLESGKGEDVVVRARAGGRLRLAISGSHERYTPTLWRMRMELFRDDGLPGYLLTSFIDVRKNGYRRGAPRLGRTVTSAKVLEPGDYTFRVRYGEDILFEEPVRITAGVITDLAVKLPDGDK